MKHTRLLILSLIAVITFSACGTDDTLQSNFPDKDNNGGGNKDEPEKTKTEMTVAYFSGEKIDPYTSANRANRAVIALCYGGLVFLNEENIAEENLASFETDGSTATFVIKENARFSDGSAVTADDIIYSFEKAKADGSKEKRNLIRLEDLI